MGLKEAVLSKVRKEKAPQEAGVDKYSAFFDESITRTQPLFSRASEVLYINGESPNAFDLHTVIYFLAQLDSEERVSASKLDITDRGLYQIALKGIRLERQLHSAQSLPAEELERLADQTTRTAYEEHAQQAAAVIFNVRYEKKDVLQRRMRHDLIPHVVMLQHLRTGMVKPR